MIHQTRKITIATSFSIFPPRTDHAQRIFDLYKQLALTISIEIISLSESPDNYWQGVIAPGLSEIRIPKSVAHRQADREIKEKLGFQANNYSLLKLESVTPRYLATLQKSAAQAIAIICYQPYLFPAIRQVSNKPIWYEATGIESDLQAKLLPNNSLGFEVRQAISKVEQQACQDSDWVITASKNISQQIAKTFSISATKIVCIPNGSNPQVHRFTPYSERLNNQKKLGLEKGFLAVFNETNNSNNIEEIQIILTIASKLKKINFLILKKIGINFNPRLIPPNVDFIVKADAKVKSLLLETADVAINPAIKNSNHEHMIEYFARGVPIVSTQLGIEEFNFPENKYCLAGETWQLPKLLRIAQQENLNDKKARIERGKQYITEQIKWKVNIQQILDLINHQKIVS